LGALRGIGGNIFLWIFPKGFPPINLNNEKQFSYVGDRNAVVNPSDPGPTFLFGFRGKF